MLEILFGKKLFAFFLEDHHHFITLAEKQTVIPLKRSVVFLLKKKPQNSRREISIKNCKCQKLTSTTV